MNDSEKHFELAVALARDALKGLLLVNGGAATALVALMDKSDGGKDYTFAILLFAAGAVSAVISACFGYFSQLNYANHRLDRNDRSYKRHGTFQAVTIFAVAITILFMIAGILAAASAARG